MLNYPGWVILTSVHDERPVAIRAEEVIAVVETARGGSELRLGDDGDTVVNVNESVFQVLDALVTAEAEDL